MERIAYPSNHFDPHSDETHAQCTECGEWFSDENEIENVEEIQELDGSVIYQGICLECKTSPEAKQALKNLDELGSTPITPPIMGELFDLGYFTPEDCKQGNHKDIENGICLWCGGTIS